jgi:hypothetical protein
VSIRDAEPSDIYVDERGKLWRVVGTWQEPVVIVEEIEATNPNDALRRMTGGVSGVMWCGFQRIYRQPPKPERMQPIHGLITPLGWPR